MRRVIVSNLMTLDGFIGGRNDELDWFMANDEFFKDGDERNKTVDTLLYGRRTFEGMAAYWPTATENDPALVNWMNTINKIVFSKTLKKTDWQNSHIVSGDLGAEVRKLKAGSGGDMIIFGSGQIVSALAEHGLIDEYRLYLHPVIIGSGKPEFVGISKTVKLKLVQARTFTNGVVALDYAPEST